MLLFHVVLLRKELDISIMKIMESEGLPRHTETATNPCNPFSIS